MQMSKYSHVTFICSPGQLKQSSNGSLDGVQRPLLHFLSPRSASGSMDSRGQASVSLSTKTSHVPRQSGACWSFTALLGLGECRGKLYPCLHDVYLCPILLAFKREESSCHNQTWPITHTNKSSQS